MVGGYLQNMELVGDTWPPTSSMRTLKYLLEYETKQQERVHQLYFIGVFLQSKVNYRVFMKLDSRYADYFPEYSN